MKKHLQVGCAALMVCCLATAGYAQEWGTLRGRIVFDGPAPKPPAANVNKDQAFCGKFDLVDETLVVNPKNGGLANAVVRVYLGRGESIPVHDSYKETADAKVRLDNDMCRFEPHVLVLRTSQTLEIANKDTVGHNTKIDTFANSPINYTIPAGATLTHQFPEAERLPTKVTCSIHPWMFGYLVIADNPYVAVSDKDGAFEIKNLPVGKWTFQFWQEVYLDDVKVDGKKTEWKRGRVELEIKPGDNDLGTIAVAPSVFK